MDIRHQLILQKNYPLLENDLDLNVITPYLYQHCVLTDPDMQTLGLLIHTKTAKNKIFLTEILPNKGPKAYNGFVDALKKEVKDGRDDYIVRALENTEVTEEEITNAQLARKQASLKKIETDGMLPSLDEPDAVVIPPPPKEEPIKDEDGSKIYFDFGIFHVANSSNDTLLFKQYLKEQLKDDKGNSPKIWHENTEGDYGSSVLDIMEDGLKSSRFYLLYIDSHFYQAYENEGKFKKDLVIMKLLEKEERKKNLIPVLTQKDLKPPFGTAPFRPFDWWKVTKEKTMENFVTSGVRPDTDGQKTIEYLRKWFIKSVLPERGNHQATASEAADSMSRLSTNDSVQS